MGVKLTGGSVISLEINEFFDEKFFKKLSQTFNLTIGDTWKENLTSCCVTFVVMRRGELGAFPNSSKVKKHMTDIKVKAKALRKSLEKACVYGDPIAERVFIYFKVLSRDENQIPEQLLTELYHLSHVCNLSLKEIKKEEGGRGRSKNYASGTWISEMVDSYVRAGGKPTANYQESKGRIDSPFVRFLITLMSQLPEDVRLKDDALGDQARKTLRSKRGRVKKEKK